MAKSTAMEAYLESVKEAGCATHKKSKKDKKPKHDKSASAIGDRVIAALKASDRKLGLDKQAYDYIGDDARRALLAHNREELGDAGRVIGGVGGTLGGAALGAGAGALAGKKYLGGMGRGAGLGALAGGVGGGISGLLAGPGWGESKAQEATARDMDRLNALADEQYRQQLAEQQAAMQAQYPQEEMWAPQQQQLYAPHQYKQSSHIDKVAETEAVPVPETKETGKSGPPSRNNFFAPHITGDYGHQQLGVEHSLQKTPAFPRDGVTNVVQNR